MKFPLQHIASYTFRSIICFTIMVCSLNVEATHIVGGDIVYRHLQDDMYEITMTIRRDCFNGAEDAPFDNPARIAIYTGEGNLATWLGDFGFIKAPYIKNDTLSSTIISDCGFIGEQVCVQEAIYVAQVRLAKRDAGYYLTYERCCRNETLNNVVDPLNTGGTYSVRVTGEALRSGNSSPSFNNWADIYICANEQLNFDHSATDADGDSLVYKLWVPYSGATKEFPKPDTAAAPPYQEVVFNEPYSLEDLMGGDPLTIDSETGILSAVPNVVGQYLIGVSVEEYRDGELLSTVTRDFEYNVRICSEAPIISFEVENPICNDLTATFNNTSTGVEEFSWNFNYPSEDAEFQSTEANPTFTFPEPGTYTVFLEGTRSEDGCSTSSMQEVVVLSNILEVNFDAEIIECGSDIFNVSLTDMSSDITDPNNNIVEWNWEINTSVGTFTGTGESTEIEFSGTEGTIELFITAENGCVNSDILEFQVDDLIADADFNAFISECKSDGTFQVSLNDNSENQSDIISFDWNITIGSEVLNLSGPSVSFDASEDDILDISYLIEFNNGCTSAKDSTIAVADLIPKAGFDIEVTQCNGDETADLLLVSTADNQDMITSSSWDITIDGVSSQETGLQVALEGLDLNSTVTVIHSVEYSSGCSSSIERTFVVKDVLPMANFTPNLVRCNMDQSIDFTLDNSSDDLEKISSIEWTIIIGGESITSNENSVSLTGVDLESTIDITLAIIYNNGCSSTINKTILASDLLPQARIKAEILSCNEDGSITVILSNDSDNIGSVEITSWMITIGDDLIMSDQPSVTLENLDGEDVITAVLDIMYSNGCTAITSEDIKVSDLLPVANFTAAIAECKDDGTFTVALTDISGNASSVEWEVSIGGASTTFTGSPIEFEASLDDVLEINQSVVFKNNCKATKDSSINVSDLLPIADFDTDVNQCNDDGTADITLISTASNSDDIVSSSWDITIDGVNSQATGLEVSLTGLDLDATVTVIHMVEYSSNCSASIEKTFIVRDVLPMADFTASIGSCNEDGSIDAIILNASDDPEKITAVEWVITIGEETITSTDDEVSLSSISLESTIDVMLSITYNNGCSSSISRSILASDLLPVARIEAEILSCNEDGSVTVILSNTSDNIENVTSANWVVTVGGEVIESNEATVTLENIDVNEVIIAVLSVNYNNGCSAIVEEEISVSELLPQADFKAEITECKEDGTYTISITNVSGNTETVNWTIDISGSVSEFTGSPIEFEASLDDVLEINQSVVFINNCKATKDSSINVSDLLPIADFDTDVNQCNDDGTADITLISTASNPDNIVSSSWDITIDGVNSQATGLEVSLTGLDLDATVTVIHMVEYSSNCSASIEKTFVVRDVLPMADFTASLISCNEDGSIDAILLNASDDPEKITAVEWVITIGEETITSTDDEVSLSSISLESTIDVILNITYNNGCSSSISRSILASDLLPVARIGAEVSSCNEDESVTVILSNTSDNIENVTSASWVVTVGGEVIESNEATVILENIDVNEIIIAVLSVNYNNGCSAMVEEEISVSELLPQADFKAEITECKEDGSYTVGITDVSGNTETVNWTIDISGSTSEFTGSPIEIMVAEEDVITITQSVIFNNGCESTIDSTVNVSDLIPTADFSVDVSQCNEDGTADLIITSASSNEENITSYDWVITVDGVTENYTGNVVELIGVSQDADVDVSLMVDYNTGCSASVERSFNVADVLPQASYTSELISCSEDGLVSVKLTENTGEEISTISWIVTNAGNEFTGDGTMIEFVIDTSSVTNIILDIAFANGCSSVLEEELDLNSLFPTPSYNINIDDCPTDNEISVTLTDNTQVNNEIESVSWTIQYTDVTLNETGSSVSFTAPRDSIVNVTMLVGLTNGCELLLLEDSFIPEPFPPIEFVSDTITGCLGDTVNLVSNSDPGLTYSWDPLEGLIFPGGTDMSNPSAVVNGTTTYTVTISDGTCEDVSQVTVAIDSSSLINIQGDSIVCDGMFELIASGGKGGGTYQWSSTSDFAEIISESDTLSGIMELRSETYFVRLVNSSCSASPASITITNAMIDLIYFNPFEICRGDTTGFNITNLDENQDITIQFEENSHIISGGDTNMPLIGIGEEETESFYLVFTGANQFGCEMDDSVLVMIVDNPMIDFTPTLEECGAYTVCFEIIMDFNGFPVWDFGDPESGRDNISFEEMPCHTYPGPGDYVVSLETLSSFCKAEPLEKTITLTEEFTVDTIQSVSACLGDTLTFNAGASVDGLNYVWCTSEGDTLGTGETLQFVADSNSLSISLKGFDYFDCSDTSQFNVDVFYFDLEFDIPEILCNAEETTIGVTNNTGGDLQYMWGPDDAIVSGEDTDSPVVSISDDTELTLTIFEAGAGCMLDTSIFVMASSVTASISAADPPGSNVKEGEDVILEVDSDGNIVDYEWSDPSLTGSSGTVNPPVGTTTFTVTVTDDLGCTSSASIDIEVREVLCNEFDVFLPNAFTPNDDNVNDVFKVQSNCVQELELVVFDRWGEEVFRTTDQNVGWDGTYKNERMSPDVYGYRLDALCINDVRYVVKGNVSLLK